MKRGTNRATAWAIAAIIGAGSAAWAVPEVSNVTMTQRENSRIVDIGYALSNDVAYITLGIETNGVALPDSVVTRLSGDVGVRVSPGENKTITWNAGIDWPEHLVTNAVAKVTAWATNNPPAVLVVDLSGGSTATSYPVTGYPSLDALPYGGVTNDLYKTTQLVFKRISAGVFMMGSSIGEVGRVGGYPEDQHKVTLTQDYYMGVFEITQRQWERVMNAKPSNWNNSSYWESRPVECVSYNTIRGSSLGAGWPTNNSVDASSFVGQLCSKTGIVGLDLPTEAQWEYACRAGMTTGLNNGTDLTNTTSDANLNLLARYKADGGYVNGSTAPGQNCGTTNATAKVGSYLPNAWGLYDMHGNVWERCLDWYVANLGVDPVTDPVGFQTGTIRVKRGGGFDERPGMSRSAFRHGDIPGAVGSAAVGFRMSMNVP